MTTTSRRSSKDSDKIKKYIALAAVAAYIASKLRRHGYRVEIPTIPPERFAWTVKARMDSSRTIEDYLVERRPWR